MFQVPIIHYEIENWDHNKKRILDAIPPECPEHADPQDNGLYTDFFLTATGGPTRPVNTTGDFQINELMPELAKQGKDYDLIKIFLSNWI